MTATEQTPGARRLLAVRPGLPAQRLPRRSGQTAEPDGRTGWYARALIGSTEALARPATDALAALLLADAMRRNGPGWIVSIRRYGVDGASQAA